MLLVARFRLLIATLWVGSLWTIGYVVAPTLFTTLYDKVLAGTIAGSLFQIEAWLSVGCALVLIAFLMPIKREDSTKIILLRLIVVMLICTVIGYFVLHPYMTSLRAAAGPAGVMASNDKMRFGILHGISSLFYLIE
ncbi:MAG: DUF4149 domain-containing protein, partial [Burkholderiaceae bacterium]